MNTASYSYSRDFKLSLALILFSVLLVNVMLDNAIIKAVAYNPLWGGLAYGIAFAMLLAGCILHAKKSDRMLEAHQSNKVPLSITLSVYGGGIMLLSPPVFSLLAHAGI